MRRKRHVLIFEGLHQPPGLGNRSRCNKAVRHLRKIQRREGTGGGLAEQIAQRVAQTIAKLGVEA